MTISIVVNDPAALAALQEDMKAFGLPELTAVANALEGGLSTDEFVTTLPSLPAFLKAKNIYKIPAQYFEDEMQEYKVEGDGSTDTEIIIDGSKEVGQLYDFLKRVTEPQPIVVRDQAAVTSFVINNTSLERFKDALNNSKIPGLQKLATALGNNGGRLTIAECVAALPSLSEFLAGRQIAHTSPVHLTQYFQVELDKYHDEGESDTEVVIDDDKEANDLKKFLFQLGKPQALVVNDSTALASLLIFLNVFKQQDMARVTDSLKDHKLTVAELVAAMPGLQERLRLGGNTITNPAEYFEGMIGDYTGPNDSETEIVIAPDEVIGLVRMLDLLSQPEWTDVTPNGPLYIGDDTTNQIGTLWIKERPAPRGLYLPNGRLDSENDLKPVNLTSVEIVIDKKKFPMSAEQWTKLLSSLTHPADYHQIFPWVLESAVLPNVTIPNLVYGKIDFNGNANGVTVVKINNKEEVTPIVMSWFSMEKKYDRGSKYVDYNKHLPINNKLIPPWTIDTWAELKIENDDSHITFTLKAIVDLREEMSSGQAFIVNGGATDLKAIINYFVNHFVQGMLKFGYDKATKPVTP